MGARSEYSDQRYYHSVLMVSRKQGGVTSQWLENRLRDVVKVDANDSNFDLPEVLAAKEWRRPRFLTINESPVFAGSEIAASALRVAGKPYCSYDLFVGEHECRASMPTIEGSSMASFLVLSTGYAALTRYIVQSLVQGSELLKRVLFLRPTLTSVLSICASQDERSRGAAMLRVTGINSIAPGAKGMVNGVRLSGADVLESGLLPKIEHWMNPKAVSYASEKQTSLFRTQGVRISSESRFDSNRASFSLTANGACKFWLRKNARNLDPFAAAIADLVEKGGFSATSQLPGSAHDSEF